MLVGNNNAPAAVEFLLHAVAGCLTSGIGNIAAALGIALYRVESTVEDVTGLDLRDPAVRSGLRFQTKSRNRRRTLVPGTLVPGRAV